MCVCVYVHINYNTNVPACSLQFTYDQTHQNRTFELHIQPLPRFIKSTDFYHTILIVLIFYNFSKHNIKAL